MNTLIETVGITEFKKVFETYALSDYECIYISLGSKFNKNVIEYQCAEPIIKRTNATWQMLPGFIRCKKTLVVCIDRFENEEIKQVNIDILKHQSIPESNIIICDLDGTIQLFENIIQFIIKQSQLYEINPNKMMIVNYLRFISPNHTENYLEENISSHLQSIISSTIYKDCLFEWFGYQPNLYNIIYRYNCRIIFYLLSHVISILQKHIQNSELSISNMRILFEDTVKTQAMKIFCKNIYDITVIDDMKSLYDHTCFES